MVEKFPGYQSQPPNSPQPPQLQQRFHEARALHQRGMISEAQAIYKEILKQQPRDFDSLHLLGVSYTQTGRNEEALSVISAAIAINPGHASAYCSRGNALSALRRFDEAIASYDKALTLKMDYAEAYYRRGNVLSALRRFDEAIASYDKAITIKQNYAEAHNNRGNALQAVRRFDEAIASYDKALASKAGFSEAYNNRGNALATLGRFDEAIASYDSAIATRMDFAEAYNNRGNALRELRRPDEAVESYDRALSIKNDFAGAYNNRGNALRDLKRLHEAVESYEKALTLNKDYAEAYNNLGNVLRDLRRFDEAVASYDKALAIKKDFAGAYKYRGNALRDLGRFEEAIASYDRALALAPNYEFLESKALRLRMVICDWSEVENRREHLKGAVFLRNRASEPFDYLGIIDDPVAHRVSAEVFSRAEYPPAAMATGFSPRPSRNKIRLGYYSADFRNHPTAYLIAQLFEEHDRNKFELHGFSFGPQSDDDMRKRISASFTSFTNINATSDSEVVRHSRALGIDVAIDLTGHTRGTRTGVFAGRCAPVQVNYLGYPGTMGASYFDYIIADHTVIPRENKQHFSEKIVYLPHSYQVNDGKRRISDRRFTRDELELPERAFVFCCFNSNWKILPDVFDVWMRLLQDVTDSVLWLFEDNPIAAQNLRREAERRGVSAERLVFAKRLRLDEHLARHRCADLFLDTLPYNAHTTASDALWAGLPVLTQIGKSFPARVAASLLNAMDLPELITHSPGEFEAKALDLALNPDKLAAIKAKVVRNRQTSPLFNAKLFSRHIEAAYIEMIRRFDAGLAPADIEVNTEGCATS